VTSLAGALEGVRFVERRGARVKGLEKPVRVIEVVPEVELPPVPEAARPSTRRRGVMLMVAGALVLAAAVTAAVLALRRDSDERLGSIGNAIAAIDGEAVAYTQVGNTPSTIAVGEGAVWVLNADDRTISKIDPEARQIVKTFGTGRHDNRPRGRRGRRLGRQQGLVQLDGERRIRLHLQIRHSRHRHTRVRALHWLGACERVRPSERNDEHAERGSLQGAAILARPWRP
jgi:hypothetical protein